MKVPAALAITLCLLALPIASLVPFARAETKPVAPPAQAAYEHTMRLKVLEITEVGRFDRNRLLKLKVARFYGKIEAKSWAQAREHETQQFTILFPASADAVIKVGDVIDYRIAGYLSRSEESKDE